MKIVNPSVTLIKDIPALTIYKNIERCGRTCYQSEGGITDESCFLFIKGLIKRGHLSVLEHANITAKIITDRGVLAELTRHRLCSFSVESTRYVSYKDGIEVICPFEVEEDFKYVLWNEAIKIAEASYEGLLDLGIKPEIARSVLPNALKTEIAMTANVREWRHILELRLHKTAHPQIRHIANLLLKEFMHYVPLLFEDIEEVYNG